MIGAVYNTSSKDVKLTIKGAGGSQTQVPVKQNSYTLLNDSTDAAILSTDRRQAGIPGRGQHHRRQHQPERQFKVPVLDGTIKDYKRTCRPAARHRHRPGETATPTKPHADPQRAPPPLASAA